MFDSVNVIFVRSAMRSDLRKIRSDLIEISEQEATYLWRLARRMMKHNCKPENIQKVREEAFKLHMNAYPERLIGDSARWEYAFKI